MSFIYQKYTFSDYVSSYITKLTNIQQYPILIFYDKNIIPSYYYSLIIQNKILLSDAKKNIIPINISEINISEINISETNSTISNTSTTSITNTNNLISSLIGSYLNKQTNILNNFIIIDCLFDYSNLVDILNKFIFWSKQTAKPNQLIPSFQIYFILTCLNYYNIDEVFMNANYDIICLTNFININEKNKTNFNIESVQSYKNLNQIDLINSLVLTNNVSMTQYIEIKNSFFMQKQQSFYKIYYLFNKSTGAINYISQWNKFDNTLIKYLNSIDTFSNINSYNVVSNSSYICDCVNSNTSIGYIIKIYKINFISNNANKLFIDQYQMGKMNKKVTLISNTILNTNDLPDLTDSIYKLDGSYFIPSYYLNFANKTSVKLYIIYGSTRQFISINDISTLYEQIDINNNGEHYKLIVMSNFKYDQICTIIPVNIITSNDPLLTVQPMMDLNNYYLFFIIITKHQFRISRYKITNNKLVLDSKMKTNQYYNCPILENDYLSDLFLSPIIINSNIMD